MTGSGKRETGNVGSEAGTHLLVHVQPRAKQTEIVGWHGDAIKIRVAAPPVDDAANEELMRFLAERLRLNRTQVRLVSGATGRRKRVAISELAPPEVSARLGLT